MTDKPIDRNENIDPDEVRLMALILGELEGPEKEEIEARLKTDPAFAKKRDELDQASRIMREACLIDVGLKDDADEPFQLSKERRDAIFATEPRKRSRWIPFNFNHPLIPVAVAASFILILFSGQLSNLRYAMSGSAPVESQSTEYIMPIPAEKEVGQKAGSYADFNEADIGSRDAPEEARLNVLLRESKDDLDNARSRLGQNKQIIEKVAAEMPRRDQEILRGEGEFLVRQISTEPDARLSHTRSSETQETQEAKAMSLNQLEVSLAPAEDFKFSVDALESAKNELPAIKLKKQDGANIAAGLPESGGVTVGSIQGNYAPEPTAPAGDDEVFELSPFSIDASDNDGYRSTSTLSGSRLRRQSWGDVGYQAGSLDTLPFLHDTSAVTQERMEDTGRGPASSPAIVSFVDGDLIAPPPVSESEVSQFGGTAGSGTEADSLNRLSEVTETEEAKIDPQFAGGMVGEGSVSLASDLVASSSEPLTASEIQAHQVGREGEEEKRLEADKPAAPPQSIPALVEYPEHLTSESPQSTFSLNVSDVSFRLAQAYLRDRKLPPAGTLRTEEFINAFEYGDPAPAMEDSVGFSWGRARWPYAHDKDVLRFSLKTAAAGRLASQPMNLVLAIDSSGSMSRVDRVEIVNSILETIGQELQEDDQVSVIGFSQDARLIMDSISGDTAEKLRTASSQLNPRGGTDLEAGLRLAYETAQRSFRSGAVNRIILFTDGAANLGNTVAEDLTELVETNRKSGIALDCFGIGFDGHNDAMLERLSRNGDGRYRFLRSIEEVEVEFGENLLGSLRPAAYDVKVQVEFNPSRVKSYQLLGYQQHQLESEDFRDNAVDAAEMGAAEAGNALYLVDVDAAGQGDLGVVRARYRDAITGNYEERSWSLPYNRNVPDLEDAPAPMRLASVATGFAALLNESPLAREIGFQSMINLSQDLREYYPLNPDVIELPSLILQAQQLAGRQ